MAGACLSVVLVTPDTYRRVHKTVSFLARQTASDALQVVIVSPANLPDAYDSDWDQFAGVQLVQSGPFRNTGHPRAVAVSYCTAPVVAFAEDHCFPDPEWAECLIRLHADRWAAVSPALGNANPGAVSWADLLLNFGPAVHPAPDGGAGYTPWHNTSYKRELLCNYGDRLEHMLEVEVRLQEDLLRRGHKLYLAGSVRASHVNLSRWRSFLAGQLLGGRLYGSARAEALSWSRARCLLYASLLPLIPLRRAPMVLGHAKRTMTDGRNGLFLLACFCGLIASGIGEASGYAFGPGWVGRRRLTYEFERHRHVRPADRALLLS